MRGLVLTAFALMVLLAPARAQDKPFASFDRASEPVLNDPHDLAIGPDGKLYVADKFGSRVVVMDPETLEIVEVIHEGKLPGVHDVSFAPDGTLYTAVTGMNAVVGLRNSVAGWVEVVLVPNISRTEGVLAHSNGRVYAMASGSGEVYGIEDGRIILVASGHFGAHDIAEAPDGTLWVADNFARQLVQYSPELERLKVIDGPAYGFIGPRYLDVDRAGRLIVADQEAHRILLIDPSVGPSGQLVGVIGDGIPGQGPGKFDDPEGVAVDGNRFYFADSDNNRIVRYMIVVN